MQRLNRLEMKSLYIAPELHRELAVEAAKQDKRIRELVEQYIRDGLTKSNVVSTPAAGKTQTATNSTY